MICFENNFKLKKEKVALELIFFKKAKSCNYMYVINEPTYLQ